MGISPRDQGIIAASSGGDLDDDLFPPGTGPSVDYASGYASGHLTAEERQAIKDYEKAERAEARRRKKTTPPRT